MTKIWTTKTKTVNVVMLSNRLQVRMIELIHGIDVSKDTKAFSDIMLAYCKDGTHLSHRIKMNSVYEDLELIAKELPNMSNEELDKIIKHFKLLDDKLF